MGQSGIEPLNLASRAPEGARVLIVDDSPQNLELLEAYLEDLGCVTESVDSGAEALERVRAERFDVIVLDVMMPKMSGFQVCEQLKADEATASIPVLMVTALNELGDVERALECGAVDFLTKPVHRQELVARVSAQLWVSRSEERTAACAGALRSLTS